ncbi:MAG: A-macroglobulin complement component [Proteobacteria bacterium]|nr:MAG: A-macroglobulin complement component [Pseudomonadota bacterium]PIE40342.1 MAG: A-macroglobulin complement component [Gammaproteobacteria bacterium]
MRYGKVTFLKKSCQDRRVTVGRWLLFLFILTSTAAGASPLKTITSKQLGGDERYLAYVSTDKPVYRANESLYLRVVVLNAADNTPLQSGEPVIQVKIQGPKGDTVFQSGGTGSDSSAGIEWVIPEGTPGGQYTALVTSPNLGLPEASRTFEVRAYRTPRLKTQVEFIREGYGPGDEVQAGVKVTRAEGGVPDGAKVTAVARVDGVEVYRKTGLTISDTGETSTAFTLPGTIATGDGTLSFIIEDGGVIETASKTIPILLQNLHISFFPESGDLVDSLESRVYVQATRPDGKPADIAGRVVEITDDAGSGNGKTGKTVVSRFATKHEGRGYFFITPQPDTRYALVLDSPAGITRHFPLPGSKSKGAVIRSLSDVYAYDDELTLSVAASDARSVAQVTLHKRERLVDSKSLSPGTFSSGTSSSGTSSSGSSGRGETQTLALDAKDSEGVLIVTLWDAAGNPLAERLIYRQPKFQVNIKLHADRQDLVPGEKVKLQIETADENGKPVEAVVGLTVTDDAVLEMIETREHAPRLPVMVYLENEVADLADAGVYLDATNPHSEESLDMLLGTQGWRRFILVRYEEIKREYTKTGRRVLAERLKPVVKHRARDRVFATPMVRAVRPLGIIDDAVEQPDVELAHMDFLAEMELALPEGDLAAVEPEPAPAPENRPAGNNLKPEMDQQEQIMIADLVMADRAKERRLPDRKRNNAWVAVREYAHQVRPNRKANDRIDFTETLYWNAGIKTSARNGKASVEFNLSDSVTGFRVMADAFGRNGALGNNDLMIHSIEPFYIEPKMPLQVTVGDTIELPVALVNSTDSKIEAVHLLVKGEGVTITQAASGPLAAGERARRLVRLVADRPGTFPLVLSASAGPYTDRVTRTLEVKPRGFPVAIHHGGLIGPDHEFDVEVTIPDEREPGSVYGMARVYPSPLANMEDALNALLRQPVGCFEQSSSTNYPLVMAQQYFMSHQGIDPDKVAKAKQLLKQGYKKLIGFESGQNGYEWFGGDPAHEALTAYGLMEFVDMGEVMQVDQGMVNRTRDWLLGRRDGSGGFKRNEKALDSFGRAPAKTTDAYVVWALLEAGEDPDTLAREIEAVKQEALQTGDSYVIALAANILYLSGDRHNAGLLAEKLANAVGKDGAVTGSVTSITRSGGDALIIETTSLAILAWLKDDERWAAHVETSMKWLFARSKAGRFGSTQSTILALKAINAYDAARAQPKKPGSVRLLVDGTPFGKPVEFDTDTKGAIELPDFASSLQPGRHRLGLRMTDGSKMPFAFEIRYNTTLPVTNAEANVKLASRLSSNQVVEGDPLELEVSVTAGDEDAPTPIAIAGIPAGLEVRHDQLKEMVESGRIDSYEVIGNDVVLYWRALKAGETRTVPISLVATIPGWFTGSASRSYLYYTDELKFWEAGHAVKITPKQ